MFSRKFVKFTNNLSIRHKQYEPLLNRCVVIFDLASGLLRRLERRLGRLRLAALQPTVRTACEAALQTTACIALRRGTTSILVCGPLSEVQLLKTELRALSALVSTPVCDDAAKRSSTFVTVVFVVLTVTLVVVFVMVIEGCKCTDA